MAEPIDYQGKPRKRKRPAWLIVLACVVAGVLAFVASVAVRRSHSTGTINLQATLDVTAVPRTSDWTPTTRPLRSLPE